MSASVLDELGKDIDENGLQHPLVFFVDGVHSLCVKGLTYRHSCNKEWRRSHLPIIGDPDDKRVYLLDGANRLDAIERRGIKLFLYHPNPDAVTWTFDPEVFRAFE